MEDEEAFERLDKYVFSLGLLVFMIYSAFPTIFKFIKNRQLWGNHGVNLKDDIINATLFSLGLSILASGCYKLDSSLKLFGVLVLIFTILQDYRSKIINKDLKSVLFLLLCLIPIIIGISVSKLMGIGIQYTRFSPIILFAIIAISLITFISSLRRLNNSK
jgi:hypothetical protein